VGIIISSSGSRDNSAEIDRTDSPPVWIPVLFRFSFLSVLAFCSISMV
jgi:hypothetical protein